MSIHRKIAKVVYINLKHRTDRNELIQPELRKIFDEDQIIRFEAIHTRRGGIGCGKSHIGVLEYAIRENLENILIIEDDFKFTQPPEIVLEQIEKLFTSFDVSVPMSTSFDVSVPLSASFDVCFFSGNILQASEFPGTSFLRVWEAQTTSGYLVNKKFYHTLLQNFKESVSILERNYRTYLHSAIDQHWKRLMIPHVFISFHPLVGMQREGFSDIFNGHLTPFC